MIEKICKIKSSNGQVYTVRGVIERECDNRGVYILRLSHDLEIVNQRSYTYRKNDTMLVASSEITN
jgi:hypothetical protein